MAQPPTPHALPLRNRASAAARLFGTLSLVPCVAVITGPLAVIFGIAGLRANRRYPTFHGRRNSWFGIGIGALMFVIYACFLTRVWIVSWREYRENHPEGKPASQHQGHEGHEHR